MKNRILSVILWLLSVIVCYLLQVNFVRIVPIASVSPNFMLIAVFTVGFLRGKSWGMATGVLCGLIMDAFSGRVFGFYVLIFTYIGYFSGCFSRMLAQDVILLPMIFTFCAEVVYSLYVYTFTVLLYGKTDFLEYLKTMVIPETILTTLCSFFVYGVMMTVNRHLTPTEQADYRKG